MKSHVSILAALLIIVAPLSTFNTIHSQTVDDYAQWSTFITGKENPSVTDTFFVQSFKGRPTDNWGIKSESKYTIIDAQPVHSTFSPNGEERLVCCLKKDSIICFENFNGKSKHTELTVHFGVGAHNTEKCTSQIMTYNSANTLNESFLNGLDGDSGFRIFHQVFRNNAVLLKICDASELYAKPGSFMIIDFVSASGKIPYYSYFNTSGNWHNDDLWSACETSTYYRSALIGANVTVDKFARSKDVYIGKGNVTIDTDVMLSVQNLHFFADDTASLGVLHSAGVVDLKNKVSLNRTFSKTGSWYFISLPFDVYPDGFSSNLTLEDDTFTGSGNYFYLKSYDGERRSSTGQNSGNWTVISADNLQMDVPILKAGHGYLLALDAEATETTLTFTSRDGAVGTSFGKEGRISIPFKAASSAKEEHKGWFLCGNPLPAPLTVNEITANADLGDSLYVYDGSSYKSLSFLSDSVVPPYAAFFIKAKAATELVIHPSGKALKKMSMRIPSMQKGNAEPVEVITSNEMIEADPEMTVTGRHLKIRSSHEVLLSVFTLSGQTVLTKKIPSGTSVLLLPVTPGFYLIQIDSPAGHLIKKYAFT